MRFEFCRMSCACWSGHGAVSPMHMRRVLRDSHTNDVCAKCLLPADARIEPLVVDADTYVDARDLAREVFHTTDLEHDVIKGVPVGFEADVTVTWVGNDAGRRTGADGRRRVVTWRV